MFLEVNLAKLVIGDLVLKAKLVLTLTVLKVKFDCIQMVLLSLFDDLFGFRFSKILKCRLSRCMRA